MPRSEQAGRAEIVAPPGLPEPLRYPSSTGAPTREPYSVHEPS
jgi:hypothetical protein